MISFPVHTESFQMQSSRQSGAPNRWVERGFPASAAAELESAGLSPLMARILASRGVTAGGLDDYLNPRMLLLASPEELEGLPAAVETVLSAVSRGMKIVVFGDYDCDGVCATAIAVTALETVGADVVPFIPDRLTEGYGMSEVSAKTAVSSTTVPKGGYIDFAQQKYRIYESKYIAFAEQIYRLREAKLPISPLLPLDQVWTVTPFHNRTSGRLYRLREAKIQVHFIQVVTFY